MTTRRDGERGSSLVVSLTLAVVLIGVSSTILSGSLYRFAAVRQEYEQERALQLAEAGLDLAFYELQNATDLDADGIGEVSGGVAAGTWQATVDPPFAGDGRYTVRSTGQYNGIPMTLELVAATDNRLQYGIFGSRGVRLGGAYSIDSYKSELGTYQDQYNGDFARSGGDVASNGSIFTRGGTEVYGDVRPGPGGALFGPTRRISGSTAPLTQPLDYPSLDYDPPVATRGRLSRSARFTDGVYRFRDVRLEGGQVVEVNGDVTLYVDSDFLMTGSAQITVTPGSTLTLIHGDGTFTVTGNGIINQSQDPAAFSLLSASDEYMEYSGNSDFYGLVYAPDAPLISRGSSDIYGAFIGDWLYLGGSGNIHFDENLNDPSGSSKRLRVEVARKVVMP